MALLFADGFDQYASGGTDITQSGEWTRVGTAGNVAINTTAGRFGSGCLETLNTGTHYLHPTTVTMAVGDTVLFGFAFKTEMRASDPDYGWGFYTAAGVKLVFFYIDAAGRISDDPQAGDDSYSAQGVIKEGVWHWIEGKITFGNAAANSSCELRVDGITVLNLTGRDYNNGSAPTQFRIYASDLKTYYDDLIIWNTAGAAPTDWIGDTRIDTLLPDGDTATVDWTANTGTDWQAVDDALNTNDDATTYIASQTAAQESRFTLAALSGTSSIVHFVQPWARAARADTVSARTYRTLVLSNVTEDVGPSVVDPGTTYAWRRGDLLALNPDDTAAWADADVNALEVGVEIV